VQKEGPLLADATMLTHGFKLLAEQDAIIKLNPKEMRTSCLPFANIDFAVGKSKTKRCKLNAKGESVKSKH
jgi:hypothetical protein